MANVSFKNPTPESVQAIKLKGHSGHMIFDGLWSGVNKILFQTNISSVHYHQQCVAVTCVIGRGCRLTFWYLPTEHLYLLESVWVRCCRKCDEAPADCSLVPARKTQLRVFDCSVDVSQCNISSVDRSEYLCGVLLLYLTRLRVQRCVRPEVISWYLQNCGPSDTDCQIKATRFWCLSTNWSAWPESASF